MKQLAYQVAFNLKLKHIPIITLTISKVDIIGYYKFEFLGYLLKSLNYDDYEIKINTIFVLIVYMNLY